MKGDDMNTAFAKVSKGWDFQARGFPSRGNVSATRAAGVVALVLAAAGLGAGCSTSRDGAAERDGAWIKEAEAHVLAPKSERVAPVAVTRTAGAVENPGAMLAEDGRSARLTYAAGGTKPVAVLDFGAPSLGGYAVFTVTAKKGTPVVRLSYACHPEGLSETGCFTRETSARYLGKDFDLPVLPGNIYRHETYTIPRTGRFIAPLIQGQTRYVRVQLDSPDTSVEIDAVAMANSEVYDISPHDGWFLCSDERLNRLWYISTWTLQIASFPNHDAWKTVDGWLLPRKLEMAPDVGLSVDGAAWRDVTIDTVVEFRANPDHVSSAGVAFRAADPRNAYLADIALDGTARLLCRRDGVDVILASAKLPEPPVDGARYPLTVRATGSELSVEWNGVVVLNASDETHAAGRVGFFTPKEAWPLVDHVRVRDARGRTLLHDDFSGDLSKWDFARTLAFIADGAKRDRLVWSGDLYFAQRSAYCAWTDPLYMRDSLHMLAFNQTPEGYVHAAPYPERATPPASGEYGPFPSDEFAAWIVPVAWDHLLHTDDTDTAREIWPAIERLLGYLDSHIGENGLFVQRAETSKHAGDLNPGDVRARSYMNILLWGTYRDAARIADRLGLAPARDAAQRRADAVKAAVFRHLWDEAAGTFRDALETPKPGFEANALAMSMGMVTPEQAARMAPHMIRVHHGKFQSLASRGKFEYGFGQSGLKAILDHNWTKLLSPEWKGATTTTECMSMITKGWGDESHPDTAIAGHFTNYILGIVPLEPGFRRFVARPQPVQEVAWAKGVVPTPRGPIHAGWTLDGTTFRMTLVVPRGTMADVDLPKGGRMTVNGAAGDGRNLAPGAYEIVIRDLPPGAWNDPTMAAMKPEKAVEPTVKASSSVETDGWSAAHVLAPAGEKAKKGFSSAAHPSADAVEWLELDLGAETSLSRIVLLPRTDVKSAKGCPPGFPSDFKIEFAKEPGVYAPVASFTDCPPPGPEGLPINLYTVIGYPSARYIRLTATRLGPPGPAAPSDHRLQLRRILLERP